METILFLLGVVGNVISVLVFFSPIKTFWRITRKRSTEDFEPTPYVITLLNSSLWVYYGVTKPDGLLVATVNGVGVVMEALYVSLFLVYAPPALRTRTAIMTAILDVGFLGGLVAITRFAIGENLRVTVIGTICAFLNTGMYASPLTAMKTVITTKSVEYMPFFLSFFLFLNGGVWTSYAIIDRDVFLGIPNGIGFVLGTLQLVLYMIYMNTKVSIHLRNSAGQRQRLLEPVPERDEEGGHLVT